MAHRGILFLDELPEFNRGTLDALRQPLETGTVVVARANAHIAYPSRVQVVAAMNPCRCGHLDDPGLACARAPRCAQDYQGRVSGPIFDRIDLFIDVPAVRAADLSLPPAREDSATVAARVGAARALQVDRLRRYGDDRGVTTNAETDGTLLTRIAQPDAAGARLLAEAAEKLRLSGRAYHRILRVARTLADLQGAETLGRAHIAEALGYRRRGIDKNGS